MRIPVVPPASAIPFKSGSAFDATSVVHVFLACALLLGLFAIGAVVARRKGWLGRFVVVTTGEHASPPVEIRRMQRFSQHTTIFVVGRGEQEFLLIESTRQVAIHPLTPSARRDSES